MSGTIDTSYVSATNRFAFALFGALAQQERGRNIFIAPASVALALAMTYNGARGETQRAIAEVLGVEHMRLDELNRACAGLLHSLRHLDPQVQLAVANSLWARQGLAFDQEFVRRNQESFGAELRTLDVAGGAAAAAINAWVREQTRGKIDTIVDRLPPAALLVLLNAIYFKGSWSRQFDARLTREAPFTLPSGRQQPVMMMAQSGKYRYYEGHGFQAVALPYGSGRLSMYIVLPSAQAGLESFGQQLGAQSWEAWMRGFGEMDGAIALPRFKIEYAASLVQPLTALGMGVAFTRRADFSGICAAGGLNIDDVRHKAFVDVNEQGTEAAAATAVTMVRASFAPRRTFHMVVDRPFFCAIRDDRSGALLFAGAIVAPA
jgi:serpin B